MRRGKYERQTEPAVERMPAVKRPLAVNKAIVLPIVLFWLVMITTYMTFGLFAKYSTMDSGSDSARVIKFGQLTVTENSAADSTGANFIFAPGVPIEKNITVSFEGSEADTFVFVCVETAGWAPGEDHRSFTYSDGKVEVMSWSVADEWTYIGSNDDQHVYYISLKANNKLENVEFIEAGQINVNEDGTRAIYKNLAAKEININVTAYVVQANGFYTDSDMVKNAQKAAQSLGLIP